MLPYLDFSLGALKIINDMVRNDFNERPTISELLEHDYFTQPIGEKACDHMELLAQHNLLTSEGNLKMSTLDQNFSTIALPRIARREEEKKDNFLDVAAIDEAASNDEISTQLHSTHNNLV